MWNLFGVDRTGSSVSLYWGGGAGPSPSFRQLETRLRCYFHINFLSQRHIAGGDQSQGDLSVFRIKAPHKEESSSFISPR